MHTYSGFWLGYCAGLLTLSSLWADRDAPEAIEPGPLHPAEALDMDQWLALPERQRAAIVGEYAPKRKPVIKYADGTERKRQEALYAA